MRPFLRRTRRIRAAATHDLTYLPCITPCRQGFEPSPPRQSSVVPRRPGPRLRPARRPRQRRPARVQWQRSRRGNPAPPRRPTVAMALFASPCIGTDCPDTAHAGSAHPALTRAWPMTHAHDKAQHHRSKPCQRQPPSGPSPRAEKPSSSYFICLPGIRVPKPFGV